jgi:hypothetical protein
LLQSGRYSKGDSLPVASKKMLFMTKWRFGAQIALRMSKYDIALLSFSLIEKSF